MAIFQANMPMCISFQGAVILMAVRREVTYCDAFFNLGLINMINMIKD